MVDPAEGSGHREQLTAAYTLVASGYDSQRFVRVSATRLVALIGLRRGAQVLDAATGTGWAAMAAGRMVGPAGQVIGVDLNPGMLQEARRKLAEAHLTQVDVREGDVTHLDFAADRLDAVVCASALFFLPDILAALWEWKRVRQPGGRVACSVFGARLFEPMRTMFTERLQTYGVSLPAGRLDQRLTNPETCRAFLREAGFSDLAVHTEDLDYYLSDAHASWEDAVRWNGGRRDLLAQLPLQSRTSSGSERLGDRAGDLGAQPVHFHAGHQAMRREPGSGIVPRGPWVPVAAEPGTGANAPQLPLRFSCRARLTAGDSTCIFLRQLEPRMPANCTS